MTAVRTPPPRLPVRDKSRAAARAWGGVSPMLTRLAHERATGVLIRERGVLHLSEGRVVHAESPFAPGLGVLLTARGTLDEETWRRAAEEADGAPGAGLLLLGRGELTRGALELCHLEALFDAAYFVLAPTTLPGRFRFTEPGRLGAVQPVTVTALERETLRRRALLDRVWPDPAVDEARLTRAGAADAPATTARQRAVLDLVDGTRTACDIARLLGRPAFHTLVDVRRLAAAGVLAHAPSPPVPPPRPTARPAAGPPPLPVRGTGAPTPLSQAPQASLPAHGAPVEPQAPGPGPEPYTETVPLRTPEPDIALLKRLRDALESL